MLTRWSERILPFALAFAVLTLAGCQGNTSETTQASSKPQVSAESETPSTRVRVQRTPSLQSEALARVTMRTPTTPSATTITTGSTNAEPTPAPIAEVLAELDKIPISVVDYVTTDQVRSVQGAINSLELKYIGARLLRGDREQAELEEKIEFFNKLAEELLLAKTPEELREKYRQLSESIKLYDAEIAERRQSETK